MSAPSRAGENPVTVVARALRQPPGPPTPEGVTVEAIYRAGDVFLRFDADALAARVVEALTTAGLLLPEPSSRQWRVLNIRSGYPTRHPVTAIETPPTMTRLREHEVLQSRRCTPWQREP